ncbi:heterodimeric geranylgeranyl pyrophosphate synthase small subunit, chloroplastic-like [Ananas comosus]|uniref:Heterodimeric geranylgeranyl pyrophosphate synthase small subunit, chloroplastic-like n=1 Tax=Ananas comosus TaxID=4615 RepID=A0A6P5FI24_ANACO|nr:heterodimeric geranylgeranyl pyrophosphate synthase small subunit, chloroplastic-like [Ananas comosus]
MASTLPFISGPGVYLTNHKFPLSTRSILRASAYSSSCGPRRRFTLHFASASASASAYSSSGADDDDDLRAHVPAAAPGALAAPMGRTIAAAPATIAPHLCAAACALLGGGDGALAADAARAIAVARSALHSRAAGAGGCGELLAGDALLPLAFGILVRGSWRAHGAALRAVVEVAAAMGASGAAGGYCMEAEGRGEDVERVVEMTDGRVGECAAVCGALASLAAAEAEAEEEEAHVNGG